MRLFGWIILFRITFCFMYSYDVYYFKNARLIVLIILGGIFVNYIDIDNWERKEHFNYFKEYDYPHINICANVDITKFYNYIKKKGYPFFLSFVYVTTKTANSIKEFRYRIRDNKIVVHDIVSPSFTVMTSKGVFSFCHGKFIDNFEEFKAENEKIIALTKDSIILEDEPNKDDVLFITSIPWVSFTNITHPINMHPVDSVPRIAWGKYFEENGSIKIPLSVQAHHAVVDGMHIGEYYDTIQKILDKPEKYL